VPLRLALSGLYTTTCPACLRPVVADYFVWDREAEAPSSKYIRCDGCGWQGTAAAEPEDRDLLAGVPARGMHYHYVLDRVAPQPAAGELRARLEPLLKLYSPRNLYALAELTLKIESLFPEGAQRQSLRVLLLDCLDRCSSLHSLSNGLRRPERPRLSRPSRFLERNVWMAFEEAVSRLQRSAADLPGGLAAKLEALQVPGGGMSAYLNQGLVRDLPQMLQYPGSGPGPAPVVGTGRAARPVRAGPTRSFGLILTSPPPLDASVWLLSSLWGSWVLGAEAEAPLHALLRRKQRTADPGWYAGVMAGALQKLGSLLRQDGRIVLVVSGQDPAFVEALLFAANRVVGPSGERLGVASFVQSGRDYRLELSPLWSGPEEPAILPSAPLPVQIQRNTAEAAAEAIRLWGEPVPWPVLHAAIYRRLAVAHGGLLWSSATGAATWAPAASADAAGASLLDLVAEQVRVGLDSPAFVRLLVGDDDEELWWLADAGSLEPPLCDRVERAAYQVLPETTDLTEAELVAAVYERFPGVLTPPPELVLACIQNCGYEVAPGRWRLRAEDRTEVRQAERQAIVSQLLVLGQRLGYQARAWEPFDIAWFDPAREAAARRGRVRAAFVVRWQAAVSEALSLAEPSPAGDLPMLEGARPYLVIPGGRAALVSYKLAHNPLWQAKVDEMGWRFIKYRHVRELAAQPDVDEYALRTIIGLDPIVEREGVQLALF
jgi:hypothetical protein